MGLPWGIDGCAFAYRRNAMIDHAVIDEGGRGTTMTGGLALGRGLRNALRDYDVVMQTLEQSRVGKDLRACIEVARDDEREGALAEKGFDLAEGDRMVAKFIWLEVDRDDYKLD